MAGVSLARRTARRRLDDVPGKWHCSIVGTCLTLTDLRKIVRKARFNLPLDADDYRLHGAVVQWAGQSVMLAKMLTKHLDKRFAAQVARFSRAGTEDELAVLWSESLRAGDVPGAYWALMTHPADCVSLRERAYGEVHMLSHLSGASQRVDMRRLSQLEEDLAEREREVRALAAERSALREGIAAAERRAAEAALLSQRAETLEQRVAELESGAALCGLRGDLCATRRALEARDAVLARVRADLETERETTARLDQLVRHLSGRVADLDLRLREQAARPEADSGPSPLPDLGQRSVLLVGGKPNVIPHVGDLVGRCNGRFLHHDGGVEDACPRLAGAVSQCDVVFCAVTCVSHEAVDHLKKNCQRRGKTFLPLPGYSRSAVERALRLVASAPVAGPASVAPLMAAE